MRRHSQRSPTRHWLLPAVQADPKRRALRQGRHEADDCGEGACGQCMVVAGGGGGGEGLREGRGKGGGVCCYGFVRWVAGMRELWRLERSYLGLR